MPHREITVLYQLAPIVDTGHVHRNLAKGVPPVTALRMARFVIDRLPVERRTYAMLAMGAAEGTLPFDPACRPGEPDCCERVRQVRAYFSSVLLAVLLRQRMAAHRAEILGVRAMLVAGRD